MPIHDCRSALIALTALAETEGLDEDWITGFTMGIETAVQYPEWAAVLEALLDTPFRAEGARELVEMLAIEENHAET